ncbi:MAG: hypothetical protein QF441_06020 [Bacteriovoracaceae bacterium]|jgi:hypothetical protein|nr:hypothetical protein [Bacteriovoracaceae bacterium]
MKLIYAMILLSLSFQANAMSPIRGQDALDIYNTLKNKLNIKEQRNGNSTESGCWDLKQIDYLGMECETANCTSEVTYEREKVAGCFFDKVNDSQLSAIKQTLKAIGLDTNNVIFQD